MIVQQVNEYLQIKVTFLVAPECVQVEESFATRGTHQPHLRCTLHTCAQIVACEVDGPSLQPSTQHQYTLLTPHQLNAKGLHVGGESFL